MRQPQRLSKRAGKYWKEFAPVLDLNCPTIKNHLILLCEAYGEFEAAAEALERDGLLVGEGRPHPCLKIKNDARTQIRSLSKVLGLYGSGETKKPSPGDSLDDLLGDFE